MNARHHIIYVRGVWGVLGSELGFTKFDVYPTSDLSANANKLHNKLQIHRNYLAKQRLGTGASSAKRDQKLLGNWSPLMTSSNAFEVNPMIGLQIRVILQSVTDGQAIPMHHPLVQCFRHFTRRALLLSCCEGHFWTICAKWTPQLTPFWWHFMDTQYRNQHSMCYRNACW